MYGGHEYQILEGWEQTKGLPVAVRVVEFPASSRFPYTYSSGECLMEYQVAGTSYGIWAAAGVMDRDMHCVADQLTACPDRALHRALQPRKPVEAPALRLEQ